MTKSWGFLDEFNGLPLLDLRLDGKKMMEAALDRLNQISSPERQAKIKQEMRGPNGYPTHEWERGCGHSTEE